MRRRARPSFNTPRSEPPYFVCSTCVKTFEGVLMSWRLTDIFPPAWSVSIHCFPSGSQAAVPLGNRPALARGTVKLLAPSRRATVQFVVPAANDGHTAHLPSGEI